MFISNIQITNFRNLKNLTLDINSKGAVLYGKNGIGKSNFIEAVSLMAFGKSFKTTSDSDLINFDSEYFRVCSKLFFRNLNHFFEIAVDRQQKKIVKIDNLTVKRISELYDFVKIVVVSPNDLAIINGGPRYRRFFLDVAISQFDINYLFVLRKFDNLLKQRNALFKKNYSTVEKKTWDKQFILAGLDLLQYRINYISCYRKLLLETSDQILNNNFNISIDYINNFTSTDFETIFKKIVELEPKEQKYQRSLIGPHLDDIEIFLEQKSAKKYSSQGQKRLLSIVLKIAQAKLLKNKNKDSPLILIDDAFTDLDQNNQNTVINLIIGDYQVIITTPERSCLKNIDLQLIDFEKIV